MTNRLNILFAIFVFIAGVTSNAAEKTIKFQLSNLKTEAVTKNNHTFKKVSIPEIENTRVVGAPELPVKSYLLIGKPESIQVKMNILKDEVVQNMQPYPVQEQECRCKTHKTKTFAMNASLYNSDAKSYSLTYLGAFRGTPITRLDVSLASYKAASNSVTFHTNVRVEYNASEFNFASHADAKDFLILAPAGFETALNEFIEFKKAKGFNVTFIAITSEMNTLEKITALIKDQYAKNHTAYAMIVGDETVIPMYDVNTSSDPQTKSDLPYYTMDGARDSIPDIFYSRLSVTTPAAATAVLKKSIEFETKAAVNQSGLQHMVGIASNQGSNPSDEEYVQSIEAKFQSVLGTKTLHLAQNDTKSNPDTLNANLSDGAFWLTYVGHGSGYTWPSMNQQYSTTDMPNIKNKNSVKAIIIDVACENGKLIDGRFGTTFMQSNPNNSADAFGAVAYYGGTVSVSWHPPAIMARGIAFEYLDKNIQHLGEALFAGQMYLAANWNDAEQVQDNFEWYMLQGDPTLDIHHE